jgi:zinc/manganese transport system substrate-binding protein
MDPDRVALAARAIADELTSIDPSVDWTSRADRYVEDLASAAASMDAVLGSVLDNRRVLVTNHDALGYFADRFGYEIAATVIPGGSTLADPSSADLAELVDTMRRTGLDVIFADTTDSTTLAEAVAAELGTEVSVVILYTGSVGQKDSGADTLIGMLETDATLVAEALR